MKSESVRQTSWDWEADYKFAIYLRSDMAEIIKDVIDSQDTQISLRMVTWKSMWYRPVTQLRLKALKELVELSFVEAGWLGLGHGSKSEFGLTSQPVTGGLEASGQSPTKSY